MTALVIPPVPAGPFQGADLVVRFDDFDRVTRLADETVQELRRRTRSPVDNVDAGKGLHRSESELAAVEHAGEKGLGPAAQTGRR